MNTGLQRKALHVETAGPIGSEGAHSALGAAARVASQKFNCPTPKPGKLAISGVCGLHSLELSEGYTSMPPDQASCAWAWELVQCVH